MFLNTPGIFNRLFKYSISSLKGNLTHWIQKVIKLSCLGVILPVIIAVWHVYNINLWNIKQRVIAWDVISYYSYLPAAFIYDDITLKFLNNKLEYPETLFWPNVTKDNQYVIKTSMGLAYMYAPFFFLASATIGLTDDNPSGFSPHYKYFLVLSGIFFFLTGLIVLRKILLIYFSQLVTFLTLCTIGLGTNLFYYSSTEATMPHVYLFTLTTLFIYITIRWYKSPGYDKTALLGLLAGIISLIRPVNIIVVLFFIIWDISSGKDLKNRLLVFRKYFPHLAVMVVIAFTVWIPQFLYWNKVTGHWVFFSYIGERFYFFHPHILEGLFGFRKGWLLYTPVMIFSLAGIPLLWVRYRPFFWPVVILFFLHIYIIYSWWCWWYGGSLGSRPMIDLYGLMAIPLAAFLQWILSRKQWQKITLLSVFLLFAIRSGLFTVQYYYDAIHMDGMTKKTYFKSFLRARVYPELENLLKRPDYEAAKKGEERHRIWQ